MTTRAAALLEQRRDELNARFARSGAHLAPDHVLGYLRRTAIPILDAWNGEPSSAVLFALFDLGLVGLRVGLVGETDATVFETLLQAHMPALRAQVEITHGAVLRAIGNGYLQVLRECGPVAARAWFDTLGAHATRCPDRTALLALGVVLGWRAGLAEARDAALEQATRLPPDLVHALFGTTTLDGDRERRFCPPGSTAPLGPAQVVATAGGFVGFGGPFRRPPIPRIVDDRLVCGDGTATWELFADAFGARLRPAPWAHGINGTRGRMSAAITDMVPGAVAVARCAGMTAVTLDDSHRVIVLGRREAAP